MDGENSSVALGNIGHRHSSVALGNRGMTVEAERQCAKDQKEWIALVHM